MNWYEIWCDLAPGANDLEFVAAVKAYLGYLKDEGKLESFSIRRRKFGFGPAGLGEWNISIACTDLAQLEAAFNVVATRNGEVERLHAAVYSRVQGASFGLYRDFPDAVRADPKG